MKIKNFRDFTNNLKSKFYYDYDLAFLTWFKAGGKADLFCIVSDKDELETILHYLKDIPIFIIGAGSNILIRDGGYRGAVIKLGKSFNILKKEEGCIYAGASILDSNLSKFALQHSITKLEFFSGIPGSVGGAIKMNAGCYGNETKEVIKSVEIITKNGLKKTLYNRDLSFSYRKSQITDNDFIISAVFKAETGKKENIKSLMDKIKINREDTQPITMKTSGSTFKNPEGHYAAKLIEQSDCKGLTLGGASVSSKHSNFLINSNNANAKDIEELGNIIRDRVYNKFKINLDWEIKIIGEHSA